MPQFQLVIRWENKKQESKLSFTPGESLLLLCQKAGISVEIPCGGKGICGKCRVRFLKNPPLPSPAERGSLTPEELRQGIRLACVTRPAGDGEVLLFDGKKPDAVLGKYDIYWDDISCKDGRTGGKQSFERAADECAPDSANHGEGYFIAADIGTTTLVMEKRKKSDGRVEAV